MTSERPPRTGYRFGDPLNSPADRHDDRQGDHGDRSSSLGWLSEMLAILGAIVFVGSIAAGLILAVHTELSCGPSTFYCSDTTHPWSAAAWGVGIGGSVQGVLMIVVGLIGKSVEQMRIGLAVTYAEIVSSRPPPRPRPEP